MPATTAVAVPTNAVTTSNTDCGYWYTIQDGDECDTVASEFGISLDNFYFLNPQLNGSCGSLWLGNAYCVEAVGNIATYSGYTTSTLNYTTLASTVPDAVTRTVNRTTTHFFFSYPTITTSTNSYNVTVYSALTSYTLCAVALADYNVTDGVLPDDVYDEDNEAWFSEYQRVCLVDPTALPTVGFNTSISLYTDTETISSTGTTAASTGASATMSSATPTSTVSPDGTCGSDTGYTCRGHVRLLLANIVRLRLRCLQFVINFLYRNFLYPNIDFDGLPKRFMRK
ncbi:hypothetical protein VM1G_06273 [Cytospora mali]|uniref:LysM domain-containing protein n=1 Tax=Cytospora mali TaxID=578113 RepID=A0A194W2K4_CYTMA|nr:hypothetical protein VM1G_06273 [Valsa mali]